MRKRWQCHLVFNANGVVRMTIGRPSLRSGEYAILVKLKVPDNLFVHAFPEATINVPENAVIKPVVEVVPDASQG